LTTVRTVLLGGLLACLPCLPAVAGEEEPASVEERIRDLVWAAADAPEKNYPDYVKMLRAVPGVSWLDVHDVLLAGRSYPADFRPRPAVADSEAHEAYFERFPWRLGEVRTYRIGRDYPFWYSIRLPDDYDGGQPVPVYLDLGALPLGRTGTPPPEGWALVELHPLLFARERLGKAPMALTAGRAGQSVVLSVVADLERHFRVDRDPWRSTGRACSPGWFPRAATTPCRTTC
jgi:hypothetical protein